MSPMLRWLAYRLPYGDPLRAVLPVTLRMLRERLADPGLLLDLGVDWDTEGSATSVRLREAHGLRLRKRGSAKDGLVELSDALVLAPMRYRPEWDSVWVRSAAAGGRRERGPDHPALKLLAAAGRGEGGAEGAAYGAERGVHGAGHGRRTRPGATRSIRRTACRSW